jgi:hypothetical protein
MGSKQRDLGSTFNRSVSREPIDRAKATQIELMNDIARAYPTNDRGSVNVS